jgi:hypothetical protein
MASSTDDGEKPNLSAKSSPKANSPIPGSSPCYYVSDPCTNILTIDALNLTPRTITRSSRLTVSLSGHLTADCGPDCRIKLTAAKTGTGIGPKVETSFRVRKNNNIVIKQSAADPNPSNGGPGGEIESEEAPEAEAEVTRSPRKGPVEMTYVLNIPNVWLKKGFYTLRAQMWDSWGGLMTDFDASVWMDEGRCWHDARGLMG